MFASNKNPTTNTSSQVLTDEGVRSIQNKPFNDPTTELLFFLKSNSVGWQNDRDRSLRQFQTFLAHHANPNKCDEAGISVLWWIIVYFDLDFLMLALAYKGNPFLIQEERHMRGHPQLPWGFDPKAPIEYAMVVGREKTYDFIVKLCTKPQASLKAPMQISHYQITSKTNETNVLFNANNKTILISIQATKNLAPTMIELIYKKYRKHFKSSPTLQGTLKDFFNHEIEGATKLIELIFCGEELVAMNLHKLIRDPRYSNCHSHYISCVYVEEEFRSLGLTDPMMLTLVAVAPKIFNSKITIGSFQALALGATKPLDGVNCFPKYTNSFLKQYATDHFEHVQEASPLDPNPKLANDRDGECNSPLPVQPTVQPKPTHLLTLSDLHFYWMREIYDPSKIELNQHRGLFFIFFVDDAFWKTYTSGCAKMNLDAGKYINELAQHVIKLIPDFKPKFNKNAVTLPSNFMLFRNQLVASNTSIPAHTI